MTPQERAAELWKEFEEAVNSGMTERDLLDKFAELVYYESFDVDNEKPLSWMLEVIRELCLMRVPGMTHPNDIVPDWGYGKLINSCDCIVPEHGRIHTDQFWICQNCKKEIDA